MRSSISRAFAGGAFSTHSRSVPCSRGSRTARHRPWRASTTSYARSSRDNYGDRDTAYKRSQLSLTQFGKAVVAHEDDFSRHNPIDRWWGGTQLTNDRLWRWNTALTASDGTRRTQ